MFSNSACSICLQTTELLLVVSADETQSEHAAGDVACCQRFPMPRTYSLSAVTVAPPLTFFTVAGQNVPSRGHTIPSGPPWSRFSMNNAEANSDGPMYKPCQNGKEG